MNNWSKSPICKIGNVVSGGTPSSDINEYWDGEIVWITPADLSKIKKPEVNSSMRRITNKGLNNSSANIIPKNSIVLSSRAPIGYCAIPLVDFATNQGCKSIIINSNHDTYFHYYNLLFNINKLKRRGEGTTFSEISKKELEKVELDFPRNINVQKKIAKILSTCDAVIEKTEETIAKYKAIKQGMMQDLFSRGINPKNGNLRPKYEDSPDLYKKTELGWLPKEWEVKRLEESTEYVDYRGKTPPKSNNGIFLITAKNIKFGYIDYEISKEYIPEHVYHSAMSRGIPLKGDVLITTEAPLGNVAQIEFEGLALAQRVIKYRGHKELNNDYLKHSFMSEYFQRLLLSESTGSTVKGIKGSRLHLLSLMIPHIDEQILVSDRIKSVELKIQNEQKLLAKQKQIKLGLMQDLLTGKIEVKVKE